MTDETRDAPILVVDDDPHLREALAELLAHEGHRVLTAEDGAAAARLARAETIGLMVLEHRAGRGPELLGDVRRALGGEPPPALVLTAGDPLGLTAEAALDAGVVGLAKPFAVRELIDAVERHRRRLARAAT